ncbi:sulfatase-like hydrolase/transferase [Zobellia galactanivorans]|uniref:Sulfatase, family S1-20 n=1 Tax=Zobellia galactanivorans (strain DSM 12802 / CCUG 47099 / CIP 106680 / NCIMB 13871 / Dsij) TaxID=63186 RepID=G0L158_ZOBGA|nr:sulfatase-like hydrolase/transferase [Zobellia galactanivorans]CAZ97655.1 Sulfatase, family S1-20 [Zobellia galactanivorans]
MKHFNKLRSITSLGILVIIASCNLTAQTTVDATSDTYQKPNIIFILTDDLGYGDLGVFFQKQRADKEGKHSPQEFTPNLDRMANEGALLPQHYSAAPVCAPSRASLLLGQSQGHSNIRDNQFDKALAYNHTLGSVLQGANYKTAAIGKWGLQGKGKAPNWPAHPLNQGFDYYLGYMRHGDGHEHYPKEGIYRGTKEVYENRTNITPDLDKCYTADLWTAAAKKWIVDHKRGEEKDRPFFMYLAYDTPHAVLELPTQAYPKGGGLNGGLQWLGEPGKMINTASGEVDSWIHPDYADATYIPENGKKPVPWTDVYKRYATDTRRIDSAVGDILQLLKDLKIDDNTLVIFTSDNGPSVESYLKDQPIVPTFFGSYGPFTGIKRDCWEGGLRMPTIARWPEAIKPGTVVSSPSISYDWMPTFSEMAGLPAPAVSNGTSLLPSLTGKGKQSPSTIYVEYFEGGKTPGYDDFSADLKSRCRNQMQMIRKGDYVGVRYDIQSEKDDFEIYNVIDDMSQSVNLGESANFTALQEEMKANVLQRRMPNATAARPYDQALVPGVVEKEVKEGIAWKSYEGKFRWVPSVESLTPNETGVSAHINSEIRTSGNSSILYFEGYIEVPVDGDYTFYLRANAGGVLRIHESTVIDADFGYIKNSNMSGQYRLKAGLHPVKFYLKNGKKASPQFKLEWSGPSFAKEAISESVLFH